MTPGTKLAAAAAIGAAMITIIMLVVAMHQRVGLFEPGRARSAFDAVLAQTGPGLTAIYVAVTPGELLIETLPGKDSSRRIDWRASPRTLFGWSEWDDVSGPTDRYPLSSSDEPGNETFKLDRDLVAHLDELARTAVERAALGAGARVTQMTLMTPLAFIKPEPPRWQVELAGPAGRATLYADRFGTLFSPTPAPSGASRIVVSALIRSWIRVTNPSQIILFDGTVEPGQSYSVPNVQGVVLRTGHARAHPTSSTPWVVKVEAGNRG